MMPKPPLKIWLENPVPWQLGTALLQFLHQHFTLTMDRDNPDFLFFSRSLYHKRIHYLCARVFYAAQHSPASVHELSDWELGYVRHDGEAARQVYMPNWLFLDCARLAEPPEDPHRLMRKKMGFCAFIQTRSHPLRNAFYETLAARRRVDTFGNVFRNRPRRPGLGPYNRAERYDELAPIYRKYKFVVSFESHSYPGYLSEKLVCALLARSVPIYWGDPWVAHLINPACFINAHDFATPHALVEHVLKVDADDDLYRRYLAAPIFRDGQLPACARHTHLSDQMRTIAHASRASQFLPQAQRSVFLREHLSRLTSDFMPPLFPNIISKLTQAWSAPQRFAARSAQDASAHRPPYTVALSSQP
ncbi:MAG: glycosyltransferase family 10 [Hyphomicrobiales bacterium]|nr:glycosyltransferase family 10 [Hyphomicrobiales bacterium]